VPEPKIVFKSLISSISKASILLFAEIQNIPTLKPSLRLFKTLKILLTISWFEMSGLLSAKREYQQWILKVMDLKAIDERFL